MNSRERLHRFAEERRAYMELCRRYYGYTPRARTRMLGASNMAGFVSALFGCGLTIIFFSTIDATILTYLKPLQSINAADILAMISSAFMG